MTGLVIWMRDNGQLLPANASIARSRAPDSTTRAPEQGARYRHLASDFAWS